MRALFDASWKCIFGLPPFLKGDAELRSILIPVGEFIATYHCSWALVDYHIIFVKIRLDKSVFLPGSLITHAFDHDYGITYKHWVHHHPSISHGNIILGEEDTLHFWATKPIYPFDDKG